MSYKYSKGEPRQRPRHKMGPELDFASAEAYKLLRTNVAFSFSQGDTGKAIGMTSPRPQDGKSFSSINLAYALAEKGSRVILIDADMRRPSIAGTLQKAPSPGLSNYLVGDAKDVIHKNVLHENLSLITAGDLPPNPAELIGSERMKHVLDALRQRYDYIIVDLPPVMLVSDALVLSEYLDGIILVARHAYSKCNDVLESVRQLKFVNARMLGFVYNDYGKHRRYRRHNYYETKRYIDSYNYSKSSSQNNDPSV